ncbi:MAG: hypothetical protein E7672_03390 [Ruminococcaceae bacterium]|nr:hypothetical protein [Oscillospiraceae bacterium]
MKVLISGFEAFGNSRRNSSLDTIISLPKNIGECSINTITLPVVYGLCGQVLCSAVDAIRPDFVISLGQAEGRGKITPEYAALNVRHSDNPDNIGQICKSSPIDEKGENAYFSTIFPDKLASHLNLHSIPASISFTAGTYVCNDLMYSALKFCDPLGIRAGFIHLPLSYEISAEENKGGSLLTLPQSVLTDAVIESVKFIADSICQIK